MRDCPCRYCNGHIDEPKRKWVEEGDPKSIYDKLQEIQKIIDIKYDNKAIYERIDEVLADIDDLDVDINCLESDCVKKPIVHTHYALGLLSQRLY